MTKYCSKCKENYQDGSKFCKICGNKLTGHITRKDVFKDTTNEFRKETLNSVGFWVGLGILIFGCLICLTIIGAILGIPLIIIGVIIMMINKWKLRNKVLNKKV